MSEYVPLSCKQPVRYSVLVEFEALHAGSPKPEHHTVDETSKCFV